MSCSIRNESIFTPSSPLTKVIDFPLMVKPEIFQNALAKTRLYEEQNGSDTSLRIFFNIFPLFCCFICHYLYFSTMEYLMELLVAVNSMSAQK